MLLPPPVPGWPQHCPRSQVAFQCEIPRELFLRLFPTAAFEAPQTELEINKETFVQVPPLAWHHSSGGSICPLPGETLTVCPVSPWQASMRWEDHPADLQLKECWLVAPGREPVLLLQGGEARGAGVAMLEGPPSSRGRKIWRFRFTYAIPEGGRVPFSATLKCKAGLQVSVTPPRAVMPPCWSSPLLVAAWWVCPQLPGFATWPGAASLLPIPVLPLSHPNLPYRTTPFLRRSWR